MISNSTPELKEAIGIVQAEQFSRENYQRLQQLAQASDDGRLGEMLEAFIAAAPTLDFMNEEG